MESVLVFPVEVISIFKQIYVNDWGEYVSN